MSTMLEPSRTLARKIASAYFNDDVPVISASLIADESGGTYANIKIGVSIEKFKEIMSPKNQEIYIRDDFNESQVEINEINFKAHEEIYKDGLK